MVEILLLVYFLTAWFGFLDLKKESGGKYSTIFIFGLGVLFYYFMVPLEMSLKGQTYYYLGDGLSVEMSPEVNIKILTMGLLSFLGFIVGLCLSKFTIHFSARNNMSFWLTKYVSNHKKDFQTTLYGIWFLSGFVVFIIYGDTLMAMGNYQSAYGVRYSSPLFSYFLSQFYICSSVIAGLSLRMKTSRSYILSTFILFVVVILAIYTSDKGPILLALLAISTSILGGKSIGTVKMMFVTLFVFPMVLLLLPLFSFYRVGIPISLDIIQLLGDHLSFTKMDPAGPMTAISYYIINPPRLHLGVTYLTSLAIIIPKFLWPSRPLDLSEQFAREQISNWNPGQGLGFSPLAEATMNFGMVGAFLHYLLFALLWGWGWRLVQRNIFKYKQEQFLIFYQVVGFFALILSFRGPLSSPIKILFIFVVPYILVFYSIRMVRFAVHNNPNLVVGNKQ